MHQKSNDYSKVKEKKELDLMQYLPGGAFALTPDWRCPLLGKYKVDFI